MNILYFILNVYVLWVKIMRRRFHFVYKSK